MLRGLYVSEDALEEFGMDYFESMLFDELSRLADYRKLITLDDKLILSMDDMYNLYISVKEEDCVYNLIMSKE